jgi:hypothetical protein
MDFSAVVHKYGEQTTKLALTRLVGRIRYIIDTRTSSAVDGVVVMTEEELRADAVSVTCTLDDFPFNVDEKCVLVEKAWEIIGP